MNQAPINVKPGAPTKPPKDWGKQCQEWEDLNKNLDAGRAHGHGGFDPLTVKAGYVIGIIHDLCETVSYLLGHPTARQVTYLPACGVFVSAAELLGRCVTGDESVRASTQDIQAGLEWLSPQVGGTLPSNPVLVQTSQGTYTVQDIARLRHFASHGQATAQPGLGSIDYEVLEKIAPLLAPGVERYWQQLTQDDALCNKLAAANIIAYRNWPVFKIWGLLQGKPSTGNQSLTQIFNSFVWHVA